MGHVPDARNDQTATWARALVLSPDPQVAAWIEGELAGERVVLQAARKVGDVIAALVDDPPPRPQIMVVDVDPLDGAGVFQLHAIRERGWFGAIIALGRVSAELETSLNIETVLARPLADGVLRAAFAKVGVLRSTMRLSTMRRPPRRS